MSKRKEFIKKIDSFISLPHRWTGYETKQITKRTIKYSQNFLENLDDEELNNLKIHPRGYNGISFVWKIEKKYLEVTIGAKKTISYFMDVDGFLLLGDPNETISDFPKLRNMIANICFNDGDATKL